MLSYSIWFSVPSFWIGGGHENRCISRVYGADGAVHHPQKVNKLPIVSTDLCYIVTINHCINEGSINI